MKHQRIHKTITNLHDHRYRFQLTIDDHYAKIIQVDLSEYSSEYLSWGIFTQRTASPSTIKRVFNLFTRLREEKPTSYWFRHRALVLG